MPVRPTRSLFQPYSDLQREHVTACSRRRSPLPPLLSPSRSIPLKVKLPTLCIVAPNTRKFGHRTLLLLFPLSVSLSLSSRRPAGWSYVTMRFAIRNQRSTLTTGWRSQKKRESARGWYLNLRGGEEEAFTFCRNSESRENVFGQRNSERAGRAIIGKPINSPSGYSAVSPCRYDDEEGGVFVSRYSTRHRWKRF